MLSEKTTDRFESPMKSIQRFVQKNELLIIAALVFFIYFFLAILKPEGIFWSLDEGGKWIYMENVLRTGSPRAPLIYPGRSLDSDLESVALFFYRRLGQKIFTWWPVGFPLLTLPFYRLLGWAGLFFLPAFAGAVSVFFSGKITENLIPLSKFYGKAVALVVAFATPLAFYSMTFWEHTLATACVLITLYCLMQADKSPNRTTLFIAGAVGSLAIFFRTETGLIILGFGIALLIIDWKRAIPFATSGVVLSSMWILANYWITGYPFGSNVAGTQVNSTFSAIKAVGNKFVPYILFNAPTIGAFDLGTKLLFIGTFLAGVSVILGLFRKTRWISALFSLCVIAICGYALLQPSLYRSVHGFLLICPMVLFSPWIFGTDSWQQNKKFWFISVLGLIIFAVGYILRAWVSAGGLQWGPRYMLALYPILMIAAFIGVEELINRVVAWKKYIILSATTLAILVGLGFEVRGYITMYLTMELYDRSASTLRAMKDEVIKTDCIWMPMVIPDLYWDGNIFTNTYNEKWESNVKKRGADSYLFVTMYACDTDPIDKELDQYARVKDGLDIKEVFFNP
jgi:hypothetical protein